MSVRNQKAKPRLPNPDGTWGCNRCGKSFPAEKFYPHCDTGKPQSTCKKCCVERNRMNRQIQRGEFRGYEPTPEEIAAGCESIRENWTETQHWQRAGIPLDAYDVDVSIHSPDN